MGAVRFVVEPDEGKSIWLAGIGVDFRIWGEETGNQFSIVEHPIEPGRLVPPHVTAVRTSSRTSCRAGSVHEWATRRPRRVQARTFSNRGNPAYLLERRPGTGEDLGDHLPAGFERFFDALGTAGETASDPAEFLQRRAELGEQYGLEFSDEWVAELTDKYQLKLLGE